MKGKYCQKNYNYEEEKIDHKKLQESREQSDIFNRSKELSQDISLNFATLNAINSDISKIVTQPFGQVTRKSDLLSMLFNKTVRETDISPELVIFPLLSFISYKLLKDEVKYIIPDSGQEENIISWFMILAPTGSGKTLLSSQMKRFIPKEYQGSDLMGITGGASFMQSLVDISKETNLNKFHWFQDEASQLISRIEDSKNPASDIKEYMLKLKDGETISRKIKKEELKLIDPLMSLMFINTIKAMCRSVSETSVFDGFLRRFELYVAQDNFLFNNRLTNFPIYKINKIFDKQTQTKIEKVFNNDSYKNKVFTFNSQAVRFFKEAFEYYWNKFFEQTLGNEFKSYYRTAMMNSFKNAVLNHYVLGKTSDKIDVKDMKFGVEMSKLQLTSLISFLEIKKCLDDPRNEVSKINTRFQAIFKFLNSNENLTSRDVQRKFNINSNEVDKIIKTSLARVEDGVLRKIEREDVKNIYLLEKIKEQIVINTRAEFEDYEDLKKRKWQNFNI